MREARFFRTVPNRCPRAMIVISALCGASENTHSMKSCVAIGVAMPWNLREWPAFFRRSLFFILGKKACHLQREGAAGCGEYIAVDSGMIWQGNFSRKELV